MTAARNYIKGADVREALLRAGMELLHERGFETTLRVTLSEAIERAQVPRSSAYVVLSDPLLSPVERFHRELLILLEAPENSSDTLALVDAVLEEQAERLASGDPVQLAIAMRELIRRTVNANIEELTRRTHWRIVLASLAAAGSGIESDPSVLEHHQQASAGFGDGFVDSYASMLKLFGLRVTPPLTIERFAAAAAAMADSIALRHGFDPRLSNAERATGPDGALEVWNMGAITMEGLVLAWTEPDPDAEVSADLSSWIRY